MESKLQMEKSSTIIGLTQGQFHCLLTSGILLVVLTHAAMPKCV